MKKLGAHLIVLVMMGACSPKAAPPLGEDSQAMAAELPGIAPRSPALRERLAKALLEKGADYKARAHHTLSNGQPRFSNRLILESSPYLLQHAHNPVDWFPWGEEAFEIARREQKPIFLSVGYSTCHWCHVMERESFEDLEVAALINKHFVAIKVDREERPDIDSLYMNAVFMLGSGGGWPMTVVMTPEKQPFFAGTYFPPRDGMRGKSKGLMPILEEIARRYKSDRGELIERAADISRKLVAGANQNTAGNAIEMEEGSKLINDWAASMERNFDKENGGFGGAPKFPRPPDTELLFRHYARTQSRQSLLMAEKTLEAMARGGIFDQIGGGFHRYATDARWLVPHFEKMLYDNAQLGALYTEAFQISQKPIYADIARRSLNYVLLEMTSPEGGFYSATDADSEGVEGKFFVWTPEELQSLLGADTARIVGQAYGVSQSGNFEGKNILHWPKTPAQTALDLKISESELWGILEKARPLLYEARKKRIPPLRDEKIISAHNGLMIGALAQAGFALNEPRFIEASKKAAQFILGRRLDIKNTKNTKRLARNANAAQKSTGYLDDHAYFIYGLLELYKATGEIVYLNEAQALQEEQDTHFWDQKNGGYFHSPDDAETLLAREKPDYDGAEPSGNSVAILNLCKLYWLSENNRYSQTAERTIAAFSQSLRRSPRALPKMLSALESCVLSQPLEIALVRPEKGDEEGYAALLNSLRKSFLPHAVMAFAREGEDLEKQSKKIAFLEQKIAKNGRATAYVCKLGACKQPTSDPSVLEKQISDWMKKIASDEAP